MVSLGLVAAAWGGTIAEAVGHPEPEPAARSTYVVRPGDTLWAIAERAAQGRDPRPLVDSIASTNGVDPGALVPGQTLVIPSA